MTVLEMVNKYREAIWLNRLEKLLPGVPENEYMCPIRRSLGDTCEEVTEDYLGFQTPFFANIASQLWQTDAGVLTVTTPEEMKDFVKKFDEGKLPEYFLLDVVLEMVNKYRGPNRLEKLLPGIPEDAISCPIRRSLGETCKEVHADRVIFTDAVFAEKAAKLWGTTQVNNETILPTFFIDRFDSEVFPELIGHEHS